MVEIWCDYLRLNIINLSQNCCKIKKTEVAKLDKLQRKYWVDFLLLISFLFCMTTGYLLEFKSNVAVYLGRSGFGVVKEIHSWSAYVITALIIIHCLENFSWFKTMTKKVFSGNNSD